METIKVLVCNVSEEPYVKEIPNTLEAKQDLVGGWIEMAVPPSHGEDTAVVICNEEGKILKLPPNRPLRLEDGTIYDFIFGNFFIVDAPIDSDEFGSLSDKQIERYMELYS